MKIVEIRKNSMRRIGQLHGYLNLFGRVKRRWIDLEARLIAIEKSIGTAEERETLSRTTALLAAGWVARYYNSQHDFERPTVDSNISIIGPSLEEASQRLKALDPHIFAIWKELHQNEEAFYVDDSEGSCSHWDHKYARLFGAFVGLFARGRLLDIGCGINGLPSYLAGYPINLISGLDPRKSRVSVDFQYAVGFNEFLPWNDGVFHTVVSGTSLDHVLSLERSFEEVRRVLAPDGIYLVWLASIAGAEPYNPHTKDFKPADRFHLFHFDRRWIEPLFEKYFSIEEICVIPQSGFDHVFYCMKKKTGYSES